MDAFAIPLVLFTAFLVWVLVEIIRGSFEDPVPLRAGITWAITCPVSGLLFGVGLAPAALVTGAVSMLALGSLGFWFLGSEADDPDDDTDVPVEPDPGPSDDMVLDVPKRADADSEIDWDAFDRVREAWEKETAPPERGLPAGV